MSVPPAGTMSPGGGRCAHGVVMDEGGRRESSGLQGVRRPV